MSSLILSMWIDKSQDLCRNIYLLVRVMKPEPTDKPTIVIHFNNFQRSLHYTFDSQSG